MKKFVISTCAAGLLILTAASPAFAAENIFQRFTNAIGNGLQRIYLFLPGDKPGDVVMRQALVAQNSLTSEMVDETITADFLRDDTSLANAKVSISAPVVLPHDDSAPKPTQQSLNINGEVTMQGATLRFDTDVKIADKTLYFKINELPPLPLGNMNVDDIKGKWLKAPVVPASMSQAQLTADRQQALRQTTGPAFQQLMASTQFGTAKKENKNGQNVFVVEGVVPKPALRQFFQTIIASLPTESGDAKARALDGVDKLMTSTDDVKIIFWVDQSTYYVTHTEIPLKYSMQQGDSANALPPAAMNGFGGPLASLRTINTVNALFITDLSKFNEPVSFSEPTDAQDAREAFGAMMMGGNNATSSAGLTPLVPGSKPMMPSELPPLTEKQKQVLEKFKKMQMNQSAIASPIPGF